MQVNVPEKLTLPAQIASRSTAETEAAGAALAKFLRDSGEKSALIAMRGEMGVGKTAFTRGFCSYLGISGVKSPTYTVVNEYAGGDVRVFHFDLYRLEGEDDLASVGYDDYLARDGYLIMEWSERLESELPEGAITVTVCRTDDADGRAITMERI